MGLVAVMAYGISCILLDCSGRNSSDDESKGMLVGTDDGHRLRLSLVPEFISSPLMPKHEFAKEKDPVCRSATESQGYPSASDDEYKDPVKEDGSTCRIPACCITSVPRSAAMGIVIGLMSERGPLLPDSRLSCCKRAASSLDRTWLPTTNPQ